MSYICLAYISHPSFYYDPSHGSFLPRSWAGMVVHYDCSLVVSAQNSSLVQTIPNTALREAAGHGTEVYLQKIHFAKVAMGTVMSTRGTDSRDTHSILRSSIVIPRENSSTQTLTRNFLWSASLWHHLHTETTLTGTFRHFWVPCGYAAVPKQLWGHEHELKQSMQMVLEKGYFIPWMKRTQYFRHPYSATGARHRYVLLPSWSSSSSDTSFAVQHKNTLPGALGCGSRTAAEEISVLAAWLQWQGSWLLLLWTSLLHLQHLFLSP